MFRCHYYSLYRVCSMRPQLRTSVACVRSLHRTGRRQTQDWRRGNRTTALSTTFFHRALAWLRICRSPQRQFAVQAPNFGFYFGVAFLQLLYCALDSLQAIGFGGSLHSYCANTISSSNEIRTSFCTKHFIVDICFSCLLRVSSTICNWLRWTQKLLEFFQSSCVQLDQ